uniref:Uncharacterized protein n=1 Tax=Arundo donax TaxID=35708 RepID=A0A0A9AE88_ARUDO
MLMATCRGQGKFPSRRVPELVMKNATSLPNRILLRHVHEST